MAYETKVILSSISTHCLHVKTPKQIYEIVRRMAQVEGMKLPPYDEAKAEIDNANKED